MPRLTEPDALSLAIGLRIRRLREAEGLTLEKLAFESELGSKGHLSDLERGLVRPTVHTLATLAERLGTQLIDLLVFPEQSARHALIESTRGLPPDAMSRVSDAIRQERSLLAPPPSVLEDTTASRGYRVVEEPSASERGRTCVPLYELEIAASRFSPGRFRGQTGWVVPRTRRKLHSGMFVARVVGRSMEPTIPDGSWCLFSSPVRGSLQGKVLLVVQENIHDADLGGTFTIKRFSGNTEKGSDGAARWTSIRLMPINPAYDPIVLNETDAIGMRVVAEFVQVLG